MDTEIDGLLEKGSREMNPAERARIYRLTEQRILERAPLVPLYHSVGVLALRREVHGLQLGPLGIASVDMEHVWLDRRGQAR